jgi:hypothetical protein
VSSEISRRRALLVVGLAPFAGVAACSNKKSTPAAPADTSAPTITEATDVAAPVGPLAPLTGQVAPDPSVLARPALVVKIDNADAAARPQGGLAEADIVFEEKVEGPVSRFAAVFHSRDAASLGPVRSGRTTDIAIVASLNTPLYAFSGANSTFLPKLRSADLVDVGADANDELYERRKGRKAPDNLFTSSDRLWSRTPDGASGPPPQFDYREVDAAAFGDGDAVDVVRFSFGGGRGAVSGSFTWNLDAGGFRREQSGTPHVDEAGTVLTPVNVIAQVVDYVDTGVRDVAGTPVPEAKLVGEGTVWVARDGRLVKGRWTRPDAAQPTRLATDTGQSILLAPGPTWVLLMPTGAPLSARLADGTDLTA